MPEAQSDTGSQMPTTEQPTRRNAIVVAAITFVGVGALAAAWPLLSSLGPDRASERPFVDVDVASLAAGVFKPVSLQGRPVWVRRWSAQAPWIVTSASCSRCGCLTKVFEIPAEPTSEALVCPCCNSRYDFAGKRLGVSTLPDLEVMQAKILSPTLLRVGA